MIIKISLENYIPDTLTLSKLKQFENQIMYHENINVKWKYGNSSNLKIYYKGLTMPPLQPLKESFCPVNKIN